MMDSQSDISSPAYFEKTYQLTPAEAALRSFQAKAMSVNRGDGADSPPPDIAAPAASPAGTPSTLNAQAEYEQLMADRASGKITTAQWHNGGSQREQELANLIANGAGAQPAPVVPAAAETHPYLGAPPSPSDYGLLHGAGELPDEQVTQIRGQEEALSRLNLNRSVVQDVNARLATYAAKFENATPAELQSLAESNYSRFTAQCAREGIDATQAEALVGAQLKAWSKAEPAVRPILEAIAKLGDPTMLDYILQIAKSNRAARR
jgi:hypothetical protein